MDALILPMTDPISEVLRSVRVQSTVYCRSSMYAPWGFRVQAKPSASFHLLTEGEGWLEVEGVEDPIRLATGDLVILPNGRAHQLRDDPTSAVQLLDDILETHPVPNGQLRYGGNGSRASLLCGGVSIDGRPVHPLLSGLPPVLHVRGHEGGPAPWLVDTLGLIQAEMTSASPGAEVVITRLTDILLIQAIRSSLASAVDGDALALRGLVDPRIGRALRAIHSQPGREWRLATLARSAALSPSAFSARFRQLTGESPMRYVARTRLARAAEYLRDSEDSVLTIAGRIGYDSDVALSKAFKRYFGVAPGAYRKSG